MKNWLSHAGMKLIHASYPLTGRVWRFCRRHFFPFLRVVELSSDGAPESMMDHWLSDPEHREMLEDLRAYTSLGEESFRRRILRYPEVHHESEFRWYDPKSYEELVWFYRSSSTYIFNNAAHSHWPKLDVIQGGHILDYGAGAGSNTIYLARRGCDVDFMEIGRIQADFIHFRARRHGLANVNEVFPFWEGRFDPVRSIFGTYDAIVACHVLEHIPDYHLVVRHCIDHLRPGGLILEESPFSDSAKDIAIHLKAGMTMKEAMVGMREVEKGVWKKPD